MQKFCNARAHKLYGYDNLHRIYRESDSKFGMSGFLMHILLPAMVVF